MTLALLLALAPVAAAQTSAGPPLFAASSAAGGRPAAAVVTVSKAFAVTFAPGTVDVPAGELVGLRRAGVALPAWPAGPGVILANGDRVAGIVTGGDARVLRFTPGFVAKTGADGWAVPVSVLAAVWATAVPADAPADVAKYSWAGGKTDAVLARSGDVTRGTVEAFTASPAGVRVKPAAGPAVAVPLAAVAAVAFDPALSLARKPKGAFARVVLANGSRISLTAVEIAADVLTGNTAWGGAVRVPLADLVALDVIQGKAVYLSDLTPAEATVDGFNGVAWPWAADRTVRGGPLRLTGPAGTDTFDKGVGTHSRTRLTYALDGKYQTFEAVVGLDPTTGRRGAVDAAVLVDGTAVPLPKLLGLTLASGPQAVRVPVAGAKRLTLVVDFGAGGDVQDVVNWAAARVVE